MKVPDVTIEKPLPVASLGCLTSLVVVLLGLGYLIYSPDTPSEKSFLVDASEQTYLETEPNVRGFRHPDPYWSVDVYYTRLGGWFGETKRIYWTSLPTGIPAKAPVQKVPLLVFTRLPARPDSVLRISMKCAPCAAVYRGRLDTVFEKPRVFPTTGYRPMN